MRNGFSGVSGDVNLRGPGISFVLVLNKTARAVVRKAPWCPGGCQLLAGREARGHTGASWPVRDKGHPRETARFQGGQGEEAALREARGGSWSHIEEIYFIRRRWW